MFGYRKFIISPTDKNTGWHILEANRVLERKDLFKGEFTTKTKVMKNKFY